MKIAFIYFAGWRINIYISILQVDLVPYYNDNNINIKFEELLAYSKRAEVDPI